MSDKVPWIGIHSQCVVLNQARVDSSQAKFKAQKIATKCGLQMWYLLTCLMEEGDGCDLSQVRSSKNSTSEQSVLHKTKAIPLCAYSTWNCGRVHQCCLHRN